MLGFYSVIELRGGVAETLLREWISHNSKMYSDYISEYNGSRKKTHCVSVNKRERKGDARAIKSAYDNIIISLIGT